MAFRLSISNSALAGLLPSLANKGVNNPATGDTVVSGASPHSPRPVTDIQSTARKMITKDEAAAFIKGLQSGHPSRGDVQNN